MLRSSLTCAILVLLLGAEASAGDDGFQFDDFTENPVPDCEDACDPPRCDCTQGRCDEEGRCRYRSLTGPDAGLPDPQQEATSALGWDGDRLIVQSLSPGAPHGIVIDMGTFNAHEDLRCYRMTLEILEPPAARAGQGVGAGTKGISFEVIAWEKSDSTRTEFVLLKSDWGSDAATSESTFKTKKLDPTGVLVKESTPLVLANKKLEDIDPITPQFDRFSRVEDDGTEVEEVEFKFFAVGTTQVLFPRSDPPPTVTSALVVRSDYSAFAVDLVEVGDEHARSTDLTVVSRDGNLVAKNGDVASFDVEADVSEETHDVEVDVCLGSEGVLHREEAIQGWSFSLVAADCFELIDATLERTSADLAPDGYRLSDGFATTQIVDPRRNGGRQGVVTAVILSMRQEARLPTSAGEPVLRVSGRMDASTLAAPGDRSPPCLLRPLDVGDEPLRGAGLPVPPVITIDGHTFLPRICAAEIRLVGLESQARFVRGDVDSDGVIQLTDAVGTLNFLFLGGITPSCVDAADADDSGRINVTDAVRILRWLFSMGDPPPPPSPSTATYAPVDCGRDPSADELDCDGRSSTCP